MAATAMTSWLLRRPPGLRGVAVEAGVVLVALLANLLARRLTLDDVEVAGVERIEAARIQGRGA